MVAEAEEAAVGLGALAGEAEQEARVAAGEGQEGVVANGVLPD